jgi:hypothetical protein
MFWSRDASTETTTIPWALLWLRRRFWFRVCHAMHSNGSSIDFKPGRKKRVWNWRRDTHTHTHTSRERDAETRERKQGARFFDYNCKWTLVSNNPVMQVRYRWCFGIRFSFFGIGFPFWVMISTSLGNAWGILLFQRTWSLNLREFGVLRHGGCAASLDPPSWGEKSSE